MLTAPRPAYLIGHRDKERQKEHVAVPSELLLDVVFGQSQEVPDHARQKGNGYHEIITVGFDEVVTGNGRRVYVVFAERTKEIL